MTIATGTLCYIVVHNHRVVTGALIEPVLDDYYGRVVTIVGPPRMRVGADVPVYPIDAPWLHAKHPRCGGYWAAESSLRPIAGPGIKMPLPQKREPVPA